MRSPTSCASSAATQLAGTSARAAVEFRASLPRTDAGKLYKRQLRDEYTPTS